MDLFLTLHHQSAVVCRLRYKKIFALSTYTARNYFVQTMKIKGFFQFEIIINVLVFHLNTYAVGLRPLVIF